MGDDIILDDLIEDGRLVSLAEVKTMLEKAGKDREDLTYEQKIALEHARRFARVDKKGAKGIVDGILKKFPDLDAKFAYKVADLVPQHVDDVRSIMQKSGIDFSDDDCEAILNVVDEFYVA